jgi:glyoxalase-like protein
MQVADRQQPAPGELYLDHVAHFVPHLDAAGRLLEELGFAVTPESAHRAQGEPAGTSNRCVMLGAGYIEILAPTLDTPNAQRVRAHMARYEGVHLACLGTSDAAAEQRRLSDHGFEPEPVVRLERTLDNGAVARFNVVYVPPEKMPEGRVQYVQQLTPEHLWRAEHLAHDNGVSALEAVYVVAENPAEAAARWARFAGLLPRPQGDLVGLETARGRILIGTRDRVSKLLGDVPPAPALAGYALACRHPDELAARCRRSGIRVRRTRSGRAAELPRALGGAWLF